MKELNVLSLFDGMSCGQQAFERANIKVNKYYASEIDKYAIQIAQKNYPNTIQVGSVIDLKGEDFKDIDILIGGSPCQNLSFAGTQKGLATKENIEIHSLELYLALKEQGFQFEGQSYLFWEYMRLLKEVQPKYFLLENVVMSKKWQQVFSKAIGCEPIQINSSLLSAQTRKRLYWTNIPNISQPNDKGLLLKDILESNVDEKYYLSDKITSRFKPTDSNSYIGKCSPDFRTIGQRDIVFGEDNKMGCLTATDYKEPKKILINQVDRLLERTQVDISKVEDPTILDVYNKKLIENGKCNTLTLPHHNAQRLVEVASKEEIAEGGDYRSDEGFRVREGGKSNTLMARARTDIYGTGLVFKSSVVGLNENQAKKFNESVDADKHNCLTLAIGRAGSSSEYMDSVSKIAKITHTIRKLTPIECERLQTIKDNYTEGVSDSQRYKMIGNGWTVDVIAHIFNHIPIE